MKNILVFAVLVLVVFSPSCEKNESSNNSNGVTFTRTATEMNIILDENIVSYNEILGYDSTNYIFLLSAKAGARIRKENYPVTPTRFAVSVDGELIYIANFIPGYSSMSCIDCISLEPYSYDNKYRMVLGYPSSDLFSGIDLRNDSRIISRLQRDNKLVKIEM
jgi:hypothetical protein